MPEVKGGKISAKFYSIRTQKRGRKNRLRRNSSTSNTESNRRRQNRRNFGMISKSEKRGDGQKKTRVIGEEVQEPNEKEEKKGGISGENPRGGNKSRDEEEDDDADDDDDDDEDEEEDDDDANDDEDDDDEVKDEEDDDDEELEKQKQNNYISKAIEDQNDKLSDTAFWNNINKNPGDEDEDGISKGASLEDIVGSGGTNDKITAGAVNISEIGKPVNTGNVSFLPIWDQIPRQFGDEVDIDYSLV